MLQNVLIVDDSPAMRIVLRRTLAMSGITYSQCRFAANGFEALQVITTEPIDLVLTDINMPAMDGEELVQQLSATGRLASLPVIVISTDATKDRMDRLLGLGARGYVTKPFEPAQLGQVIASALESPRE